MRRILFLLTALVVATTAYAVETRELILNEWNCVRNDRKLDDGDGSDSIFGTTKGNGGNWVELVVTEEVDSLVGYRLYWENAGGGVNHEGWIEFLDDEFDPHGVWDNLEPGTIITIMEADTGITQGPPGQTGLYRTSDVSYNGTTDKWIHVALDDDTYVEHGPAGFIVDNDDWQMMIVDANDNLVQDWVGEAVTGFAGNWGGGNINTYEVGKLQADADEADIDNYDAGDNSTFGAPNTWGGGMSGQAFPW